MGWALGLGGFDTVLFPRSAQDRADYRELGLCDINNDQNMRYR